MITQHHAEPPSRKVALISLLFLIIGSGIVVLLAKALSPIIESLVISAGAPLTDGRDYRCSGVNAEKLVALTAAHRNRLQTSINLALRFRPCQYWLDHSGGGGCLFNC